MFKKYCKDCNLPTTYHIETWLDEITDTLMPKLRLSQKFNSFFDILLEQFFAAAGLIKMRDDFLLSEIQMRSACFINEARKRGVKFKAGKGPIGYTNNFCAEIAGKTIRFESLPIINHMGKYDASFVNCKERTKNHLKKGKFPIPEGEFFWFWQKNQALKYGVSELGFPLVVKPRGGSVARHVTTDIQNKEDLQRAIDYAIAYSPAFVVERFVKDSFVHRVTVVDFDYVAVVKQIPANIVGNGSTTIKELIEKKNDDGRRGKPGQKEFILYKLVVNDTTIKLLAEKDYNLQSIPRKDEVVYLQKDPFLKLGGDLVEVTNKIHPSNIQLFKDIAKSFDTRLVGIDFIIPDISRSWKDQPSAILELNSVPCIEMHHFPSSGIPQNVAGALVDSFFKYYL